MTKIRTHLARQLQGRGTTPPAMMPVEAPGPAQPQRGAEVGGWAEESAATRANINQVVTIVTMLPGQGVVWNVFRNIQMRLKMKSVRLGFLLKFNHS